MSRSHRPMTRRHFLALSATTASLAFRAPAQENPAPYVIRQDWHMHTWRAGGKDDALVEDIITTNAAYGLDLMGISEHIDRLDEREPFKEKIAANRREAAVTPSGKMKVMIGTETSMINPTLCSLGDENAALLDYRLVSCNHYHLKHVENPEPKTAEGYAGHYLDMLWGATELGYADTIGHPFYHAKLRKYDFDHEKLMAILKAYDTTRLTEVLKQAAAVNMAFELNPRHVDNALEWFKELVQEARLHGTKFTLGTDAHDIAHLGYPDGDSGRTCGQILAELGIRDEDLKWEPIVYGG